MLQVAKVLKSNGTEGELLISFLEIAPEDIDLQEPVFIYFDGLPVPYYFESFTPRGTSRALVRLTGVRSLKDADELAGREVFADYFEEESEEDLAGWTVIDAASGAVVGIVSDYEDIPGNLCIWVRRTPPQPASGTAGAGSSASGDEVLLPLHEDLIHATDPSARTITLTIPEGLL